MQKFLRFAMRKAIDIRYIANGNEMVVYSRNSGHSFASSKTIQAIVTGGFAAANTTNLGILAMESKMYSDIIIYSRRVQTIANGVFLARYGITLHKQ